MDYKIVHAHPPLFRESAWSLPVTNALNLHSAEGFSKDRTKKKNQMNRSRTEMQKLIKISQHKYL